MRATSLVIRLVIRAWRGGEAPHQPVAQIFDEPGLQPRQRHLAGIEYHGADQRQRDEHGEHDRQPRERRMRARRIEQGGGPRRLAR
jgi:hypothetical protein